MFRAPGNNMGQRYVPLALLDSGDGTVTIPAPSGASLAPPGYYMLFVVDDGGVPSLSRNVRLATRIGDLDFDGDVDAADYAVFSGCLNGPEVITPPPGCAAINFAGADSDGDDDVDLDDYALLAHNYTG